MQLEIKNEELESKARLAEASLETVSEELELVQEQLALVRIESSYSQLAKADQETAEPKTIRHIEIQTDSFSFLSIPTQSSSPQKNFQIDVATSDKLFQATGCSPTVNIIKNLILSPSDISNNITNAIKKKQQLRHNVFSREFSLNANSSATGDNRRYSKGSPTPLKTFLNDHMDKLKKWKDVACTVDPTKKYCISGGKMSKKHSLANSNNESMSQLRKSDTSHKKSWLNEFINTKSPVSPTKYFKRSLDRGEPTNDREVFTPSMAYQHNEFSRQLFAGKAANVFRSSIDLNGDSFASKLGSIMKDRELFKRRTIDQSEKEGLLHAREIYQNFKSRLSQRKSNTATNKVN